jgi:hypothetical protein
MCFRRLLIRKKASFRPNAVRIPACGVQVPQKRNQRLLISLAPNRQMRVHAELQRFRGKTITLRQEQPVILRAQPFLTFPLSYPCVNISKTGSFSQNSCSFPWHACAKRPCLYRAGNIMVLKLTGEPKDAILKTMTGGGVGTLKPSLPGMSVGCYPSPRLPSSYATPQNRRLLSATRHSRKMNLKICDYFGQIFMSNDFLNKEVSN